MIVVDSCCHLYLKGDYGFTPHFKTFVDLKISLAITAVAIIKGWYLLDENCSILQLLYDEKKVQASISDGSPNGTKGMDTLDFMGPTKMTDFIC
jgi:hypothetical protein